MKSSILLLLVLCLGITVNAQDSLLTKLDKAIFVEFFGPGFQTSINYQQKIWDVNETNGLFFRVGLGPGGGIRDSIRGPLFLTIPVGLHYNFSKSSRFEVGAGAIPFVILNDRPSLAGYASFAYYITKSPKLRIFFSPIFHSSSLKQRYFGVNSPVTIYGGLDWIILPLKKK